MKKLIIAFLALVAFVGANAQNANRGGFFIEAGIGGTTGTSPRTALFMDGNNLMAKFAGGAAFDVQFGVRAKTSNHCAFDLRIGAMAPFSAVSSTPVFKLMPGLRYTSTEIFGNMSIYGTVAVGGAVSFKHEFYTDGNPIPTDGSEVKFGLGDGDACFGVSYTVAVGLNITNHFYAGPVWDAQYMIHQTRLSSDQNLHWGMFGIQLGYRF